MKASRFWRFLPLLAIVVFSAVFSSCSRDDDNPNLAANRALYDFMEYWYLWYDKMPAVDVENFSSPVDLLEVLRYQELDRWSYITTKQDLQAYYEEGTYVGYGFGSAFDASNNLWITFVFENSPLAEFGIDRGWRITAINNTVPTPQNANSLFGPNEVGVENTITFLGPNQETVNEVFEKSVITMNTVLMDTVYTINETKVGYFVLKGFITPTIDELDVVFSSFQLQGVKELIVDLRYNTGGSLSVSNHLASQIAGTIANEQVFATLEHNDKRQDENNSSYIVTKLNSLILSRVVFITSGLSASASEVLINGLKPHMEVVLVGGNTYGKPVGMYGKTYEEFDWAFVPICFRVVNANGEGDFYEGIPVDYPYADGVTYAFGDLNESSLFGAINYLTGIAVKSAAVESDKEINYPQLSGLRGEIGAW